MSKCVEWLTGWFFETGQVSAASREMAFIRFVLTFIWVESKCDVETGWLRINAIHFTVEKLLLAVVLLELYSGSLRDRKDCCINKRKCVF